MEESGSEAEDGREDEREVSKNLKYYVSLKRVVHGMFNFSLNNFLSLVL